MRVLLGVVLLASVGCRDLMAPMPGHPELIPPYPSYSRWYATAEQCSGLRGDFSRVRWYRYEGVTLPSGWGINTHASAATWAAQHKIALASRWTDDSATVIHESLHDITQRSGHAADIGRRCGSVLNGSWH